MTIALDGESALDQASGDWPLSAQQQSFDLLQDIRHRIKSLSIKVNWKSFTKDLMTMYTVG